MEKQINILEQDINNLSLSAQSKFIKVDELVEIDGSQLEGGGQILRISLTLSILFQKKLRIYNIRGKRSNPGLQRQHLAATQSIINMSNSAIEGGRLNSKEILVSPGDLKNVQGNYKCDCNGAGSIGLLIQQILPCVIYTQNVVEVEMIGGTIVNYSPPTYYCDSVLKPLLKKYMGINFECNVKKHGVYPVGLGIVNFKCNPVQQYINPINIMRRGNLVKIIYRIASTNNFKTIKPLDYITKSIYKELKKIINAYMKIKNINNNSNNNNFEEENKSEDFIENDIIELPKSKNSFTIFSQVVMEFENTIVSVENIYSDKKENAEVKDFEDELIQRFTKLLYSDNVCCDEYTVDHLILFMALANGTSQISVGDISLHTQTAFEVVKTFVPGINIQVKEEESNSVITIQGIAWQTQL